MVDPFSGTPQQCHHSSEVKVLMEKVSSNIEILLSGFERSEIFWIE
jgi:hypothetical protein